MDILKFKSTAWLASLCFLIGVAQPDAAMAQVGMGGIDVAQQPLFTSAGVPPLMMMVMSRDEQLYNKAYSDYSNLHAGEPGDTGRLSTTYDDSFDYSGYFDAKLCYTYDGSVFKASSTATGHACSGKWSGNFLNWVTMSRLDVVRHVLYGGLRSTDTADATSSKTVLERAAIPNDLHAWVKIYQGSDISSFTPYSTAMSFCNASFGSGPPKMLAAAGKWTEWTSLAAKQCTRGGSGTPTSANTAEFDVRVQVCETTGVRESFCRPYARADGTTTYKPAGLLQQYGEGGKIRFGLMTGSYAQPRSGGRLRRNIGIVAGNAGAKVDGCAPGDEIDLETGRFCPASASSEGIIQTIDQFKLVGWDGGSWSGGITGAAYKDKCEQWGGRARKDGKQAWYLDNPGGGDRHCSAWGNPLSELYAEALRYLEGDGSAPTSSFVSGSDSVYLANMPDQIAWKDPYGSADSGGLGNPYCAKCSILVLSTGLNSFDSDEIPALKASIDAKGATDQIGALEGIDGGEYPVGRVLGLNGSPAALALNANIDTASDTCTSKTVDKLGNAIGICPDLPSAEGSYRIAGLAYKAWTLDMRPDLVTSVVAEKPATYKNQIKTFAVSLAESLPSFGIPVGGKVINFSPLCQSNSSGKADRTSSGWASCRLGASIQAGEKAANITPQYTYGRDLVYDTGSKGYTAGSYSFVWEDSTYGSDNDLDVTQVVSWCVGSQCSYQSAQTTAGTRKNIDGTVYKGYDICWRSDSTICGADGKPVVADGEVLIRTEITSTAGGYAMMSGFGVSGTTADGAYNTDLANGSGGMGNNSLWDGQSNPPGHWSKPSVTRFVPGAVAPKKLENPLWYAAKYGSFTDVNKNGKPDPGEWDSRQSGVPDNFFAVTNPSKLKEQLAQIFDQVIADAKPSASVATSTPRYTRGSTLAYEASYNSEDWSGDLKAYKLRSDGTYAGGTPKWSASDRMPTTRTIVTPEKKDGGVWKGGLNFDDSLPTAMKTTLQGDLDPDVFPTSDLIAYLRGDQSKEQGVSGCTVPSDCPFRKRGSKLGDILNSTPAVVGVGSQGFGSILADAAPTAAAAYGAFVTSKKSVYGPKSEKPVVYVGANDGMLHALDGSDTTDGGKELFAFVPNAVLGEIHDLASPGYTHRYFVDGSPTVSDAYLGGWKTVLVASVGAGGRGVYALDITSPRNFDESKVMWEFNSSNNAKMGQFVGRPYVGLTEDDKWVAVFGNGYNSKDQTAVLFIRQLDTGAAVKTLDTKVGCAAGSDGCVTGPNGLATAVLVDNDGNGKGDTIYAGDYLGNLWRFEYTASGWVIGNGKKPIFKATDSGGKPQSITSGVYTVANPLGGTMVVFGTGRYLNADDADSARIGLGTRPAEDSIYGIWDSRMWNGTAWTSSWPIASRFNGGYPDLVQQQITGYTPMAADGTGGYREATRNPVDFRLSQGGSGSMGWYIDLACTGCGLAAGSADPMAGERVTATPQGILGDVVFNTLRPEGDSCEPGSQNAALVFDALTGAASYVPVGGGGGTGTGALLGTDTVKGPPPGEPPIIIIGKEHEGVPCMPGSDGCTPPEPPCDPADPTCVPPEPAVTSCSWRSPNPTNRTPGKLIPCGRISWRQLR